ncbi:MAG: tetratricopeptide repeat protein [Chloroflexota bacterium]
MDAHTQSTRGEPNAPPDLDGHCPACAADATVDARFCSACGFAFTAVKDTPDIVTPTSTLEALQRRVSAGELNEAIPDLEALVATYPKWTSAQLSLGIAYLRAGRIHEAQETLEIAEQLDPANFSCEVAFAEIHARLGFFDRAVARLDRALGLIPPSQHALSAAMDLQHYCREHAKKLYYRQLAFPRWPFSWPQRFASRPAELNMTPTRSIAP